MMHKTTKNYQKDRTRRRIHAAQDVESYEYIPAKEVDEYPNTEVHQLVAIYARVSTDDPAQTSSFELQQKYYEDFIRRRPKWKLYRIYSDEGKSGTTTAHREGFNEMLKDAFDKKFDLIIVKNISRLARNVVDFLSTIRKLNERKVGVLFESEGI